MAGEQSAPNDPSQELARAIAEADRLDKVVAEKDREIAGLKGKLAAERVIRERLAAQALGEWLNEWGVRLRVDPSGVHLVAVE